MGCGSLIAQQTSVASHEKEYGLKELQQKQLSRQSFIYSTVSPDGRYHYKLANGDRVHRFHRRLPTFAKAVDVKACFADGIPYRVKWNYVSATASMADIPKAAAEAAADCTARETEYLYVFPRSTDVAKHRSLNEDVPESLLVEENVEGPMASAMTPSSHARRGSSILTPRKRWNSNARATLPFANVAREWSFYNDSTTHTVEVRV